MSLLMIWSISSPSSVYRRRWLVVLILVLIGTHSCAFASHAQESGASTSLTYDFPEQLVFELSITADAPVAEVVLYYGQTDERLVRRIYPAFTPGPQLFVEHVEELEPGQFAPGTQLRFWWQVYTTDGQVLRTAIETVEYTDTGHEWQVLAGEMVDLYWYGDQAKNAGALLERAEKALVRIQDDIGVPVSQRVAVYAYNSADDMSRALSRRSVGYDDRVLTLGVAVGGNTLLLLSTHQDADMVIAHELTHVVVGLATENPYSDLPRWLDEGLAMYAEGELPQGNRRALEKAVADDQLISIRSMTSYSGNAADVDLYYGQAYSILEFMLDAFGREQLQQLLAVFAEGARQEDALRQVYGFGLDELDGRWRESLGLDHIVPRALDTGRANALAADVQLDELFLRGLAIGSLSSPHKVGVAPIANGQSG